MQLLILAGVVIVLLGIWRLLVMSLGVSIAHLLRQVDRRLIGTDVELGRVKLGLGFLYLLRRKQLGCQIDIHDAVVYNPPGFDADYLVKADRILVDIQSPLVKCSGGLVLKALVLLKVHCVIEYGGTACFSTQSNLQTVLEFMGDKKPSERSDPAARPQDDEEPGVLRWFMLGSIAAAFIAVFILIIGINVALCWAFAVSSQVHAPLVLTMAVAFCVMAFLSFELAMVLCLIVKISTNASKGMDLKLEELELEDVTCQFHSTGMQVHMSDVHYDDFTNEVGSYFADDILWVVMQTLVKTAMGAVGGSRFAHRIM